MVSVTSRLTTGVTETAGGGAVPWAAATLHEAAIMSAQKAASEAGEADIEVLLAARVMPRILRFTRMPLTGVDGHNSPMHVRSWAPSAACRRASRHVVLSATRSEERRVGKEWRCWWWRER